MSVTEFVVAGTLMPDGTLELDQKPNLSPGRIQVALRQESVPELPQDDPFWQRDHGPLMAMIVQLSANNAIRKFFPSEP